jgi:hypothetical protein
MSHFSEAKREIPHNPFAHWAACAAGSLGVLGFWSGMWMAARRYPSEYDWRYMTLSSLTSPARNPAGHLWASAGFVLCGLCGLYWAAVLARQWNRDSAGNLPDGIWALRLGNFFTACAAVVPRWLLPLAKGHEILALLAFTGLCLGTVHLTFLTVEQAFLQRTRGSTGHARWYAVVVAGAAVFPVLLAGLAQAYVFYALPQLHWVNLSWRDCGVPVYLSFAFWEWSTCVVLSAYMAILPLAALMVFRPRKAEARQLEI